MDTQFVKVEIMRRGQLALISSSSQIGDEYLDLEHHYKLVTKAYLALGKDGYEALSQVRLQ